MDFDMNTKLKAFKRQKNSCAKCGEKINIKQISKQGISACQVIRCDVKNNDKSFYYSIDNCIYLCEICYNIQKSNSDNFSPDVFKYSHGNDSESLAQHVEWKNKINHIVIKSKNEKHTGVVSEKNENSKNDDKKETFKIGNFGEGNKKSNSKFTKKILKQEFKVNVEKNNMKNFAAQNNSAKDLKHAADKKDKSEDQIIPKQTDLSREISFQKPNLHKSSNKNFQQIDANVQIDANIQQQNLSPKEAYKIDKRRLQQAKLRRLSGKNSNKKER